MYHECAATVQVPSWELSATAATTLEDVWKVLAPKINTSTERICSEMKFLIDIQLPTLKPKCMNA